MKNLKEKISEILKVYLDTAYYCAQKSLNKENLEVNRRLNETYTNQILELFSLQKQEIVKEIDKAQKKWIPCNDKHCNNQEECKRANFYIKTIWNPTFNELKQKLTKLNRL